MIRFLVGSMFVFAAVGCDHAPSTQSRPSQASPSADSRESAEIFTYVSGILNGLDQFDTAVSLKDDTARLNDAARRLLENGVPPTLISQLNQWAASQPPVDGWHRDALLESLPDALRSLPQLKQLDSRTFTTDDGFDLRQAVWLRNISQSAAGQAQNDLELAVGLFDWVVRNIQLDGEPPPPDDESEVEPPLPLLPWQLLLLGHGRAIDRAWLFTLLARQQGLDVVVLSRNRGQDSGVGGQGDGGREDAGTQASETPDFWLPALLLNDELYLFDAGLGLPIPGPDGTGVATLSQAAGDDAVLRQLDLDADDRYPLSQADLSDVAALVEASPMYLCERMALVESQLSGDQKIVLSVNASGVAERAKACPHVAAARLWSLPYDRADAVRRGRRKFTRRLSVELEPFAVPYFEKKGKGVEFSPALWRARTLHLFGKYVGPGGASRYYQIARPADADQARQMNNEFAEAQNLMQVNPDASRRKREAVEHLIECARTAKQDASYWLGLIALERQDYETAIDYFSKRTLEAYPEGPWTNGAHYNLARAYEASGKPDEAIEMYREVDSPQRHGNLLRARKLKEERGGP
ncbi:MAG TPA: tetratricopeptide repeat protein [Pirellulales bacterium]|nr:tetratricopeptide repeat protein [Pirellulales bacterium]